MRTMRAEVGAVVNVVGGQVVSEVSLGLDLQVVRKLRVRDQLVVERVMETGQSISALVECDFSDEHRSLHVRSVMAVPVKTEAGFLGVMILAHGREGERFSDEDEAVTELMASMTAVSMQNVEWMQRTVEKQCQEMQWGTSRLVQRTLLPDPGTGADWLAWESYYRPATALGGDYFDLVHLPDDSVVVAVGDVCDHGIPAALLMTAVRALLRTLCLQGHPPARVLEEINRALCQDPSRPKDLVVSLFVGSIDRHKRVLRYANAGQVSPLFWDSNQTEPAVLVPGSAALGQSLRTPFLEKELSFGPDLRLFLYSDGVIETGGPQGELFGLPRLRQSVSGQMGFAGAEFIVGLRKQLQAFSGMSEARDDVTMLWLGERSPRA